MNISNVSNDQIQSIVQQVVKNILDHSDVPKSGESKTPIGDWGVFDDMNNAGKNTLMLSGRWRLILKMNSPV